MVLLAVEEREQDMKIVLATRGVVFPMVPDRENVTLACFLLLQILNEIYIGVEQDYVQGKNINFN